MSALHASIDGRLGAGLDALCAALFVVTAAGCSGGDPPAMSVSDGGLDAFDASAVYAGEGTACRFSTECGELQLCVDDACARHERFEVDDLTFGEPRVAAGYTAPPFTLLPQAAWTRTLGGAASWMLSSVQPGRDGPQLVIMPRQAGPAFPPGCAAAVIGATTRAVEVPGIGCHAVTVDLDGRLFFFGRREGDDAQVFARESLPVGSGRFEVISVPLSITDTVRAWGYAEDSLAMATSIIADETGAVVSVRLGAYEELWDAVIPSPEGADRIAFLFLDDSGNVTLLPRMEALAGDNGWLVRDERGLSAVMFLENPGTRPPGISFRDVLTGISMPRELVLTLDRAFVSRVFQLTSTNWVYSVNGSPPDVCRAVFVSSEGDRQTYPWLGDGCGPEPPFGNLYSVAHGAQNPGAPVWVGHPQMKALVLTPGIAPAIRGFATPESAPVLVPLPLEFGWDIAGYGAVSRFGKSVEGYYHFEVTEPQPNAWFELPLMRIGGGL